jgi:hypothetical protein
MWPIAVIANLFGWRATRRSFIAGIVRICLQRHANWNSWIATVLSHLPILLAARSEAKALFTWTLRSWVRIRLKAWRLYSFSVLCCPVYVEAFATGWSLVERSLTKCLNKIKKPVWRAQAPYKDCRATDNDDDDDDDISHVLCQRA